MVVVAIKRRLVGDCLEKPTFGWKHLSAEHSQYVTHLSGEFREPWTKTKTAF